jgi:predicted DNA-binding protein (MmcQ/YjbR family)
MSEAPRRRRLREIEVSVRACAAEYCRIGAADPVRPAAAPTGPCYREGLFAACHLDDVPLQLSLKCDPDHAIALRAAYPAIAPGYHLNKRHWNTITLDGSLPDQMVADLLGDSYDLVVASLPRARRPA